MTLGDANARRATRRAQANLPAFAIAVLLVTSTTSLSLFVVDGAFGAANRDPVERARASGLAASLVDADSPIAERANVLTQTRLSNLNGTLDTAFPAARGLDLRITLDDTVLVERGTPTGGTTMRRLVLVAERDTRTIEPEFTGSENAVTLPRRASSVNVTISPPPGTTVTTLRVNDRVVLHDPTGLEGAYDVSVSRFETARLAFDASDQLTAGSVRLRYRPATTRKAVLEVTVDA